jgi:tRNA uridine 5-carboxymethylaminomethyl modification enzyme
MGGLHGPRRRSCGIHFRILNASKGPAVRATRAQIDRALYKVSARQALENQPNLTLFQQAVDDVLVEGERCAAW